MRLPDGEFVWGLGDNSKTDFTVQEFKAFARRMYASYMGALADTNVFDLALQSAITVMQDKLLAAGHLVGGTFTRGVLDLETEYASGFKSREPVCVVVSIGGAGSQYDNGYQWDLGEKLDKKRCWHQGIGYDTTPVPMMRGVAGGVAATIVELDKPRGSKGLNCTVLPWGAIAYSMGAIVFMIVLMRVMFGDLGRFKATYMGSVAWGNPMRQHGHTFPGCSYSDGEGIVTPLAHDVPEAHWDFACDKAMRGAPGDDLYSKLNKSGMSAAQLADMRSVWEIVGTGNPLTLAKDVAMLGLKPSFSGDVAAAKAALMALDFFVIKGITAHTSYGTVYPINGDPRDCWAIALDHMNDLVARLPVGAAL